MWFRASHATRFRPWILSKARNDGYGQDTSRHAAAVLRNMLGKAPKSKNWSVKCVCVCVTVGNRDVRELGPQAGVGPLRTRAERQCDRGGLADPRQPALPHICSLHQTGGPGRCQVCDLDPSECFHWTVSKQLGLIFPTSSLIISGLLHLDRQIITAGPLWPAEKTESRWRMCQTCVANDVIHLCPVLLLRICCPTGYDFKRPINSFYGACGSQQPLVTRLGV